VEVDYWGMGRAKANAFAKKDPPPVKSKINERTKENKVAARKNKALVNEKKGGQERPLPRCTPVQKSKEETKEKKWGHGISRAKNRKEGGGNRQ